MISREALNDASAVVYRHMQPTPQFSWPILSREVGAEVWLKHENATPTGAFKVRGGLVPHGNSVEKNAAMEALGAGVIIHGKDFQEALEHSASLGAERALELVPPFHEDLVAGVSTYAKEFFDAAGQLDAIYVPVGMGSGINGVIAIRDLLGFQTEIIGAVSSAAPATALSHVARKPVSTPSAHTFADGVATRSPDPRSLAGMYDGAARIVQVDDDAVADAMRLLYRSTHHLPEPAGAIAVAALWAERDRQRGRRVGCILTGSNMDTSMAALVLSGQTPG